MPPPAMAKWWSRETSRRGRRQATGQLERRCDATLVRIAVLTTYIDARGYLAHLAGFGAVLRGPGQKNAGKGYISPIPIPNSEVSLGTPIQQPARWETRQRAPTWLPRANLDGPGAGRGSPFFFRFLLRFLFFSSLKKLGI